MTNIKNNNIKSILNETEISHWLVNLNLIKIEKVLVKVTVILTLKWEMDAVKNVLKHSQKQIKLKFKINSSI